MLRLLDAYRRRSQPRADNVILYKMIKITISSTNYTIMEQVKLVIDPLLTNIKSQLLHSSVYYPCVQKKSVYIFLA